MGNFEFTNDHSDEAFISVVADSQTNRHPYTGEAISLRTSLSDETEPREGLTAFTVSELMQGMGSYTPSGVTWDAFNQTMSGDLGHFIDSEGGAGGTLGARAPLLAHDIANGRRGFDDGIFTQVSGINGGVSSVTGGTGTTGGQTPHAPPGNTAPGSPGDRTGGVEAVIAWGRTQIGVPYNQCIGRSNDPPCGESNTPPTAASAATSGRFGPNWYDCSGFVTSAFFFGMGLEINPAGGNYNTTYSMLDQPDVQAVLVSQEDAQAGDVLISNDHTAIYLGDGQILDSGSPGVSVRSNWMHGGGNAVARYYRLINLPW